MSLLRPLLNGYLRLVEKRKLARTRDVLEIRRDFAKAARTVDSSSNPPRVPPIPIPTHVPL